MWPIIPANDPAKVSWVRVIVQTHQPRQECTGNQKRGTCVGSSFHELGRNSAWGTDTALTRIIHEDFYYNRRYAATTSLTAGGLATQSINILFQVCLPPSRLRAPVSHGVSAVTSRTLVKNPG
jgi:hypothetical protein